MAMFDSGVDCGLNGGQTGACGTADAAGYATIGAAIGAIAAGVTLLAIAVGDTSEIRSKTAELNAMTQLLQPPPSLADLPEYQFLRQQRGGLPQQPTTPARLP